MKSRTSRLVLSCCSLLLIFGLTACGGVSKEAGSQGTVSKAEQKLNEEVFPKEKVVDVKITIDSDDFQDMLDNASAEEYKQASVDYNGLHFDNIGIRTKGNLSLRSVVQMTDSDRYSFKLSFDEYVNQTLDGISKINLNNNYSDASSIREFLTYELAEQMGLPTPKYSFVNIYINDELWGFYLAVEQIGDAYLNRHFGNAYGALYKGQMTGSGSDLSWLGDDPSSYTGLALKSKETNDDILIDMLDELNNGSDYERVLDVKESLKYIALNVLTNNMDSYIGQNKQNYYLYEDDGIFSILPWDYNMAFGGMGGAMGGRGGGGGFGARGQTDDVRNQATEGASDTAAAPKTDASNEAAPKSTSAAPTAPSTDDASAAARTSSSSLLIDEPTQGAVAERPLVAKLLAVDEYKELYHSILQEASDGYLADDTFTARVNELAEMIAPYVKADPNAFYTYEEFQQAVPSLIATNTSQIDTINKQLDGTLPSSGDGSGSGGGMGGFGGGGMNRNRGQNTTPEGQSDSSGTDTTAPQGELNGQFPAFDGQMQQPPGGADGQTEGQMPSRTGQGGGQMPPGAADGQMPDFSGQGGAQMPRDNTEGGQAQMPQGGFPGGGEFPALPDDFNGDNPMAGGGRGGFGFGQENTAQRSTSSTEEAITAGASILFLVLASIFIVLFRRKRL